MVLGIRPLIPYWTLFIPFPLILHFPQYQSIPSDIFSTSSMFHPLPFIFIFSFDFASPPLCQNPELFHHKTSQSLPVLWHMELPLRTAILHSSSSFQLRFHTHKPTQDLPSPFSLFIANSLRLPCSTFASKGQSLLFNSIFLSPPFFLCFLHYMLYIVVGIERRR